MGKARDFLVTLYDETSPNGLDVTAYLEPDFAAGRAVGEERLMQYEAADMRFSFRDYKNAGKAARYWSQRILRSGDFSMPNGKRMNKPCIRVEDVTDYNIDPANAKLLLFFGQLEPGVGKWDDVARTSLTFVSQLSYGDRLNAAGVDANTICSNTAGTGSGNVWTAGSAAWAAGAGDYVSEGLIPGDQVFITGSGWYVIQSVDGPHTLTFTAAAPAGPAASYVSRQTITWPICVPSVVLTRRLMRVMGNTSPNTDKTPADVADVVIGDYKLGTTQADSDYNLAVQEWADAGKPPNEANSLSEIVPVAFGDCLGFVCVHGKLYRLDASTPGYGITGRNVAKLTHITVVPDGESAAVSKGSRLFYYNWVDGSDNDVPCLCVVQTEDRQLYTRTENDWLSPWTQGGQALGNLGLGAAKFSSPAQGIGVSVMANMAYMMAAKIASDQTKRISIRATGTYHRVIKSIHILSIGDGTNDPGTGVGAAINKSVTASWIGSSSQSQEWTPADSVCVGHTVIDAADRIFIGFYTAGTKNVTQVWSGWFDPSGNFQIGFLRTVDDEPAGGMAVRTTTDGAFLLVGFTGGYAVIRADSPYPMTQKKLNERPPSRFICSLPLGDGAAFILGNDSTKWARVTGASGAPTVDELDYGGTLPTGFKMRSAGNVAVYGPSGGIGVPCVYQALNSKQQEYSYSGWCYADSGTLKLNDDLCVYPIPGATESDIRPPMMFSDTNENYYRFVVPCSRMDGDRLCATIWYSSIYAVPMVAWNPVAHPLTVREALIGIAKAHGCLLKLMDIDKPTSTGGIKVQTRHSWIPPAIGLAVGTLNPYPRVTGTEYYLGAQAASCYGEEINVGSTGVHVSRFTHQIDVLFTTPNWVRAIGAWIVDKYPEADADYPDGRRWFAMQLHKVAGGIPHYGMVNSLVTLSCWTAANGVTPYGLLMGLAPDGPKRNTYKAVLLEFNPSAGLGGSGTAPDPTIVGLSAVAEVPAAAPTPASAAVLVTFDPIGKTTAERLALSPDEGTIVYDVERHQFMYWDGVAWTGLALEYTGVT